MSISKEPVRPQPGLRVVVSIFLVSLAVTGASHGQDETRKGWHGEVMPAGLSKGPIEGEYLWHIDGSIMVYVPAGTFTMGSEDGDSDERPVREVLLDAFYIDKYEVSWRQWRLSGLPLPMDINGRPIRPDKPVWGRGDSVPVSYIKWTDAKAYCAWAGKRLPTEAEWEKAARGTDGRIYPWGNDEPTFDHAVWKDHPIGKNEPAPIDCCPEGASPYGALNMAGNIYEWIEDVYESRYYAASPDKNPRNDGPGPRRVLRGGAFVFDTQNLRAALRYRQWDYEGQDYVGLRTVISAFSEEGAP